MERILCAGVSKRFARGQAGISLLRKQWGGPSGWFWALQDVDLSVSGPGRRIGIIGENGSGKTTLLRIIAGVTEPTGGTVTVRGRVVPLLELGAGMHPDLTGRENIYLNGMILGMQRGEVRRKLDRIAEFAGVVDFLDTPLKHYSVGMTMRLGFSVATHVEADILLLDEAWGVGDAYFQTKSAEQLNRMHAQGVCSLLVSHDLEILRRLTDQTLWLKSGRVAKAGPTGEVIRSYLASRPGD